MTASAAAARVARVIIESPLPQLDRLFDYSIPAELQQLAVPGVRVRVPLRSAGRIADGFIVEIASAGEYSGVLSALEAVVSPIPVLAPEVWRLARAVADRAAGAASDVVRLAVPKRQVRVEKAWLQGETVEHAPTPAVHAQPLSGYDFTLRDGIRVALDAVPRVCNSQAANGSGSGPS